MVTTRAFFAAKSWLKSQLPRRTVSRAVYAAAAAPTVTVGTSTSMVSPQIVGIAADNTSFPLGAVPSGLFTFTRGAVDSTSSGGAGVAFANVTTAPSTYAAISAGYEFLVTGNMFELQFANAAGKYFNIKIDDQYVTLTPYSVGTNKFFKFDFTSVGGYATRRVTVFGNAPFLNFVAIEPTGGVSPARVRGPRCIIVGDSFTAGAGASAQATNNFGAILTDLLGWDDVWCSGVAGTGYLATNGGASPTFRGRFAHDVGAYNPAVIWFVGSVNDDGIDPTAIQAEATLLYQAAQLACPNAAIIVSPTAKKGVSTWANNKLLVKDALKAAALACGCIWADPTEMPLTAIGPTALAGTLYASASASATTVNVIGTSAKAGNPQPYGHFDIGSGSTRERVQVKSAAFGGSYNSGNNYYWTCTLDGPLQYAHSAGEAWAQVGPCYLTGHGQVGTTAGWGNADLLVSSDGTHPGDIGHAALAENLVAALLSTL